MTSVKAAGVNAKLVLEIAGKAAPVYALESHINRLKALSFRRRLRESGQKLEIIANEADAETPALLDKAMSIVSELEDTVESKDELTGKELVEVFEDHQIQRGKGESSGLGSGFSDLDNLTNGFKGGQLILIAGRPKMGKTILACNFSLSALDQGKAVLFASFELRADELADRFVSMLSGVPLTKLETGYGDDKTTEAKERLYHDRLIVVTGRSFNVLEFKARTKKLKQRLERRDEELGLIVVDLLTHLKAPGKERRELEVAFVSRELKVLAQELDVPIVAVSQLNRSLEHRPVPRPQIADLRESGSLEQDADKILLLYRPEYYLTQKAEQDMSPSEIDTLSKVRGKCELNVAAQRQGKNGIVWLQFDGECTRFRSLSGTRVNL